MTVAELPKNIYLQAKKPKTKHNPMLCLVLMVYRLKVYCVEW